MRNEEAINKYLASKCNKECDTLHNLFFGVMSCNLPKGHKGKCQCGMCKRAVK